MPRIELYRNTGHRRFYYGKNRLYRVLILGPIVILIDRER